MFVFLQQDFTPEKKSGGRGVKKAGGRGKKKVNQKAPSQTELPVTKLGVFSLRFQLSSLFLCDIAEGFVWLWFRLGIGIGEESSRQRLGGREASTGCVWLRIPVWLKVWIGIRSSPAEGPTGSQERCEFSFALLFTTASSTGRCLEGFRPFFAGELVQSFSKSVLVSFWFTEKPVPKPRARKPKPAPAKRAPSSSSDSERSGCSQDFFLTIYAPQVNTVREILLYTLT